MKILNRLYFQELSTDKFLEIIDNPVRVYEDEMIEGAIMDVGCGQSSTILDYIHSDRKLVAVDNEQSQLDYLRKRVQSYNPDGIDNWSFICTNFPDDSLFDRDYSLLIFSHLLHFFELPECIRIGKLIADKTKPGTLVYSRVHSHKHYTNKPEHSNNEDRYFKHFFTVSDLDMVFPSDKFKRLYSSEIECEVPLFEHKIHIKWLDEVCRKAKITNRKEVAQIKKDYFKDQKESYIDTIYRRL